jgi:murein L,D-transpeptidase YcbB/YkuD
MLPLKPHTRADNQQRDRISARSPFRATALFAVVLSAAGCASSAIHPSRPVLETEVPSTQSALQQILLGRKTAMDGVSSAEQERLLLFYEGRNFQPAWTGDAEAEEMAVQVRAVLARVDQQGLRNEDYKLLQADLRSVPGVKAAQYDLALTDAVLRYSLDVRTGRVRLNDIYEDIDLPAPGFDAVADLSKTLKDHSLASFLADLPPSHPQYSALVKALAQYRAIAAQGGWPALPGEKEIRLEGNDRRLSVLVQRLRFEDPILAAIPTPSTAELRDGVKRLQARNGLEQDGRVKGETLAALNVPALLRVAQIEANMERWRWLPAQFEHRYVAVNVPDQSVQFVRDGAVILSSRAIVGRKTSPTPITRSTIIAVVVNPPWNIPGDIAARDLLPKLRRNPDYLASKNMVVTDGPPGDPHGRTIDWRKILPAEFPYAIRQLPGPNTALGTLMLDSPNDFDVYLHDTPAKKRFESNEREISNGCVRVQQIFPLASLALSDDPAQAIATLTQAAKSHDTRRLALANPLPVYFLYWTALAGPDGTVEFRLDRYGRDAPLIAALTKAARGATPNEIRMSTKPQLDASPMEGEDPSP